MGYYTDRLLNERRQRSRANAEELLAPFRCDLSVTAQDFVDAKPVCGIVIGLLEDGSLYLGGSASLPQIMLLLAMADDRVRQDFREGE